MDDYERSELKRLRKAAQERVLHAGALIVAVVVALIVIEQVSGVTIRLRATQAVATFCLIVFCLLFGWSMGSIDTEKKMGAIDGD